MQKAEAIAPVKIINSLDIFGDGTREHAQYIEVDAALLQQLCRRISFVKSRRAVPVHAVGVRLFIAVQRQSDEPLVLREYVAPLVVDQGTVGLHSDGHRRTLDVEFGDQPRRRAKEVFARQQRLSALKRQRDGSAVRIVEDLTEGGAQRPLAHHAAKRQLAQSRQRVVKTIFASHVAQRRRRFEHHRNRSQIMPPCAPNYFIPLRFVRISARKASSASASRAAISGYFIEML